MCRVQWSYLDTKETLLFIYILQFPLNYLVYSDIAILQKTFKDNLLSLNFFITVEGGRGYFQFII